MHVKTQKTKKTTFERTSYTDSNRQVKTQKKEQKRSKKKPTCFPFVAAAAAQSAKSINNQSAQSTHYGTGCGEGGGVRYGGPGDWLTCTDTGTGSCYHSPRVELVNLNRAAKIPRAMRKIEIHARAESSAWRNVFFFSFLVYAEGGGELCGVASAVLLRLRLMCWQTKPLMLSLILYTALEIVTQLLIN